MSITIGNKLRELRIANGFTLQNVADKLGVTRGYLSVTENGGTIPSIPLVTQILAVYGKELEIRIVDHGKAQSDVTFPLNDERFKNNNAAGSAFEG